MLSLLKVLHKAVFQLLPASSKRVVIPTHSCAEDIFEAEEKIQKA